LLVFIISLWLCDTFFRVSGIYGQAPELYFLPIYFSFGFGPLIYFYTRFLTRKVEKLRTLDYLHFVPMALQGMFYLYLQMQDYSFRRDFWIDVHQPYTYDLELALSFVSLSAYLLVSRGAIASYKRKIENSFSSTHYIALRWLDQLHLTLFLVSFFWLIETVARMIWQQYDATPLSSIMLGFIVAFIAIGAVMQSDLNAIKEEVLPEREPKESESSLSPEEESKLQGIQMSMAKDQLYLQPELTLRQFARQVSLSPRETSRLINKGLELSFVDFVNHYRIEHFKTIAKNPENDHLSLLGKAFDSGFNSKSTFNRVFKKAEGMSPSSYVDRA
jgi:AraC-like DNA-binding protein